MAGPTDLFDLCAEWLEACKDAVATTDGGPIDRTFVSPGAPALDCCPQLTVHAASPAEGDTLPLQPPLMPGERTTVQGAVHLIAIVATVVRCVPILAEGGELPTAVALETAANETLSDVWAIWAWTRNAHRAGTLFPSGGGRRELFFDPAIPLDTSGGCAGWRIPIRVQLDGYKT